MTAKADCDYCIAQRNEARIARKALNSAKRDLVRHRELIDERNKEAASLRAKIESLEQQLACLRVELVDAAARDD